MADIESGEKQDTSLDASEQVPERTFKDTPKEAKLHGRQCPSDASLSSVSQASLRRYPNAVAARLITLPLAGNLSLPASSAAPTGTTSPAGNRQIIPKCRARLQVRWQRGMYYGKIAA